jgi:cellulose 1,4-beta-cellobiosidase
MQGILEDAKSKPTRQLVVFIVYDLPNRDCKAKASNGEICCTYKADGKTCDYLAPGDCANGISDYQINYIDPMYSVLAKYHDSVDIVLIIEPDSLPNLATNLDDPNW